MAPSWTLRPAVEADGAWIAELRAVVLRADLQRLGRFDPVRVRQRFLDGFRPADTQVIVVDGAPVGCIALRAEPDGLWLEHFYLDTGYQGRGIGSAVLDCVLGDGDHRPFRLNVLQGSAARRLYERHGFAHDHEDAVDVFLLRPARLPRASG